MAATALMRLGLAVLVAACSACAASQPPGAAGGLVAGALAGRRAAGSECAWGASLLGRVPAGGLAAATTDLLRLRLRLRGGAKSKNHTNHNQSRKAHRNGIKRVKRYGCAPRT
jgi:hypothetical protein